MKNSCNGHRFAALAGVLAVVLFLALWSGYAAHMIRTGETRAAVCSPAGQVVRLQGHDLHYRLAGAPPGSGRPLLLVHGFNVTGGAVWDRLAPCCADRPLIIPDMLGFGRSERVTEPVDSYTHRGQAALLAALLDHLGVETVDVVGTSFGGGVSCQLALDHPERVGRLIIVDGQCYHLGGGIFSSLGRLPLGLGRALTWDTLAGGPRGRRWAAQAGRSPAELLAREEMCAIRGTTDAFLAMNDTPRDAAIPDRLGEIRHHTLVIWGADDPLIPLQEGERLATELPHARLAVLEGCGHHPQEDNPREVARLVTRFLEE